MMKSIALLVIAILVIDVVVIAILYTQQTGKLTAARANIVNLEKKVSTLTSNIETLRRDVSNMQAKLTESEAKATTLQVKLAASEAKATSLQKNLAELGANAAPAPTPIPITAPIPGIGPAAFITSNLKVTPSIIEPGNTVTVVVTVTNTGGQTGTYTIVLKINEEDKEIQDIKTQDVTLAAGASQNVSLVLKILDEGHYVFVVDELSELLEVIHRQ